MTGVPAAPEGPSGPALVVGASSLPRIPMVVLGGWLGSGKTTLLNRLLRCADAGERIAVLVNDVGEVNLDVDLVASRDGDIVELTNGCICCSIGESLSVTLRDLVLNDRPPDRVVIEASGIAEPDRVAAYGDRRRLRPDGVVVVVDATDLVARAADQHHGPLVRRQVEAADLLLVTKADLAADGGTAARAWCAEVASGTPVLNAASAGTRGSTAADPTTGSDRWVAQILGGLAPGRFDDLGSDEPNRAELLPALDLTVETRAVQLGDRVDVDRLAHDLGVLRERVGAGLLRAKAVVTGTDGAPTAIHLASGRVSVEPAPGRAAGTLVLIATPGTLDGLSEAVMGEVHVP